MVIKEKLQVKINAEKLYKRKLLTRISSLVVASSMLILGILYVMLYIVNKTGNFTISLDPNLKTTKNIVMSETSTFETSSSILKVKALEYMDNITESWIPTTVTIDEGDHSANDYLAYTFFVKNEGKEAVDYYREIRIQSVIKNVDKAVRIALYVNDVKTVYAKLAENGLPEPGTTPFLSRDLILKDDRNDFRPEDVDKYTVVVWLEGEDPECVDDIIGGEMKMLMQIKEQVEE